MTENILQYLGIKKSIPTLDYLKELVFAYCCRIPWENVSKIVKKNSCKGTDDCARLEDEFWTSAFLYGTGGTCYESNLAFFYFLRQLGFEGYLTINNIIDKTSVHSAIIIVMDNNKYIIDVGYPLYFPISVLENSIAITKNKLISYRSTPIDSKEYLIENFPHPKPYLYHLADIPVTREGYLSIANKDYDDDGLFLDRIIIRKMISGVPTRFDSEDLPHNIHSLQNGQKLKTYIEDENLIDRLSNYYELNSSIIQQAFEIVNKTSEQQKAWQKTG